MMFELLSSILRLAIPLIFAALGGLLSERSGIANIALEAQLLVSAFVAATVAALTHNLFLAVGAGATAGVLTGAFFAAICVWGRGDQIVVGTGLNILAAGALPVLSKAFFNVTGSTPALALEDRFDSFWPFVALVILAVFAIEFLFRRTIFGLRISAAGENPVALRTQGVNVNILRLKAVCLGAFVTSLGGIYMSLYQVSGYVRDMSAGRGFIALAALIFGGWKPLPTIAACLFFAFTDSLQIQLQSQVIGGVQMPSQLIQILPYVVTLLVLALVNRKIKAPTASNQPNL